MPSWNDPSNTNPVHTNVLEDLGKKDTYALTMGQEDPGYTDLPTGTMTWDNNQKILRRREGGTPLPAVLSLAGGGTGATDAAGARTVLQVNKSGTADGEARTNAQNDLRYLKLTTDFSGLTDKAACFNNIKQAATSSVTGVVKLNNTLTSTATDAALTAAQGSQLKTLVDAAQQSVSDIEQTFFLGTSSNLTSGNCRICKRGSMVSIVGNFSHTSGTTKGSAIGYLSSSLWPSYSSVRAVYQSDTGNTKTVKVEDTGRLSFSYASADTTTGDFCISYHTV